MEVCSFLLKSLNKTETDVANVLEVTVIFFTRSSRYQAYTDRSRINQMLYTVTNVILKKLTAVNPFCLEVEAYCTRLYCYVTRDYYAGTL